MREISHCLTIKHEDVSTTARKPSAIALILIQKA